MINLQELDEHTASVPVANNGEQCSHLERLATAQALANRTAHHQKTLTGAAGTQAFGPTEGAAFVGNLTVPTSGRADLIRNIALTLKNELIWLRSRVFGANPVGAERMAWLPTLAAYTTGEWTNGAYTTAGILAPYTRQGTLSANYAAFNVPPLPANTVISELKITAQSPVSHGGNLPTTMPRIALVSVNGSGVATEIAGQVDTSASAAAFEAVHSIIATFTHFVIGDQALQLHVRGENDANAQANSFRIFRASLRLWYEP